MPTVLEWLQAKSVRELAQVYRELTGRNLQRFPSRQEGVLRIGRAAQGEAAGKRLAKIQRAEELAARGAVVAVAEAEPQPGGRTPDGPKAHLVLVNRRRVRPENVAKAKAGPLHALQLKPPAPKDRMEEPYDGLNYNYATKDRVRRVRQGSRRGKLLAWMEDQGVTVPEVMALFPDLSESAAVFMLRNLHITGGHGLVMRKGRVYLR